eukprot:2244949-Prymnesium_polylepis.1
MGARNYTYARDCDGSQDNETSVCCREHRMGHAGCHDTSRNVSAPASSGAPRPHRLRTPSPSCRRGGSAHPSCLSLSRHVGRTELTVPVGRPEARSDEIHGVKQARSALFGLQWSRTRPSWSRCG